MEAITSPNDLRPSPLKTTKGVPGTSRSMEGGERKLIGTPGLSASAFAAGFSGLPFTFVPFELPLSWMVQPSSIHSSSACFCEICSMRRSVLRIEFERKLEHEKKRNTAALRNAHPSMYLLDRLSLVMNNTVSWSTWKRQHVFENMQPSTEHCPWHCVHQ